MFNTLAASTFLFFSLPVVIAIDANNITQITSSLSTGISCNPQAVSGVSEIIGLSIVDGNLQCTCLPYPNDAGLDICGGDHPACNQVLTTYLDGSSISNGTCATCYTTDFGVACHNILNTDTVYDTSCSSGEVLFTHGSQSCGGCDTPENIAANPGAVACSNVPPENSYAACISTQLLPANVANGGPAVYAAQCSFTCVSNYELSSDGNSCTLITIPTVPTADHITNVYSELYTTQHCNQSGVVAGIYLYNGVLSCGCTEVDSGVENCTGATPACISSQMDYLGQSSIFTATCTTCDPHGCQNSVSSTVYYDSACPSGTLLYIGYTDSTCPFCGAWATPEFISYSDGMVCVPVENSYATCTQSRTTDYLEESLSNSAICSFVCISGYQTSTDGTGCVLSPSIAPSGLLAPARRKNREMAKRQKLEKIFQCRRRSQAWIRSVVEWGLGMRF